MYPINAETPEENQAHADAFTLLQAWEIRQDRQRLKNAQQVLTQQAYNFKSLAELCAAELR